MGKRCCGALDRLAIDVPLLKEPKTGTLSEQPGVREHPRRLLDQVNSDADLDPTKPQPDQQEDDGQCHQDLLRLAGRGPSPAGKPTVEAPLSSDNSVQTPASISPAALARFDAAAAWKRLSPVQQNQIGAAAMIHAVGVWRADRINTVVGWDAAEYEGARMMVGFVHNALGEDRIASLPLPDLTPIGIRACRVCGCTEDCACPGGCSWVAPSLCNSCAPALVEAAADLPPALRTFIERDGGTAPDDDPTLNACLKAHLVGIYSGRDGWSAWFATDYAKLLRAAGRAAQEVEAHD